MWSFVWGNPSALVCCKTSLLWTWCWILPDESGLEAFVSDLCSLDIVTFGDKPSRILASSLISTAGNTGLVCHKGSPWTTPWIYCCKKGSIGYDEKYLVCDFLDFCFSYLFICYWQCEKLHPLLKRFFVFSLFFFFNGFAWWPIWSQEQSV